MAGTGTFEKRVTPSAYCPDGIAIRNFTENVVAETVEQALEHIKNDGYDKGNRNNIKYTDVTHKGKITMDATEVK